MRQFAWGRDSPVVELRYSLRLPRKPYLAWNLRGGGRESRGLLRLRILLLPIKPTPSRHPPQLFGLNVIPRGPGTQVHIHTKGPIKAAPFLRHSMPEIQGTKISLNKSEI